MLSLLLPASFPGPFPHTPPPIVWLPLSFSFFQVVVVAAAACPTCVVVIDLSLMGGSRCRLRLPQQREMWQMEREGWWGGGACRQRDAVEQPLVLLLVLLLQHAPGQETIDICLSQRRIRMQQQQTL